MPGGDRNNKGQPTDFVFHLSFDNGETTACGRKNPNIYTDGSDAMGAATCTTCILKSQEFGRLLTKTTEQTLFTGGTTRIEFKNVKTADQFMKFIKWQQKRREQK